MIFMALAAAAASALVGVDRPIITGADFVQACQSKDARQKAACFSYLTAVIGTADAFHAQSERMQGRAPEEGDSFFCPTEGFEALEAAAIEGVQGDPAFASRPAALGVLSGLLDAYPCPLRQPESEPEPDEDLYEGLLNGLGPVQP